MFKAQYKRNSASGPWITISTARTENQALRLAMQKKDAGALMVRVIDKNGNTVFSG